MAKRIKLFEETYPQAGKDSDVLHLNVGGSTNVAVLRRTLTHFENSMLAARFSGHWDDTLERDTNGVFLIEQDPKVFLSLLNYLRQCDQKMRNEMKIQPPPATSEFCNMFEYYGLVYPQECFRVSGTYKGIFMTRERTINDSITICTSGEKTTMVREVPKTLSTRKCVESARKLCRKESSSWKRRTHKLVKVAMYCT